MPLADKALLGSSRRLHWFAWRGFGLAIMFGCGLAGFLLGADVSDRPGMPEAGIATKIYYTIGLFVLGGMDLGVPNGGPAAARMLLWFAYFGAPAITASAVIEGVLRAINPQRWRLRRMRQHVIIGGCGRVAMLYLRKLRKLHPRVSAVVVESRADHRHVAVARDTHNAVVVHGDVSAQSVLDAVHLRHARRILLMTGDDFANLDAAAKILAVDPGLAPKIVVHVSDLRFLRLMEHTRVSRDCAIFNTYQIAAARLVDNELIKHFEHTDFLDLVILAGFGRFGQTILDELQKRTPDSVGHVVIIDRGARVKSLVFDDQVGFDDTFEREIIDADAGDLTVWQDLEGRLKLADRAPVFIVGTGDEGMNVRVALRLSKRFPDGLVVARTYFKSAFVEEVSNEAGFLAFSVADLVTESMPRDWFD